MTVFLRPHITIRLRDHKNKGNKKRNQRAVHGLFPFLKLIRNFNRLDVFRKLS